MNNISKPFNRTHKQIIYKQSQTSEGCRQKQCESLHPTWHLSSHMHDLKLGKLEGLVTFYSNDIWIKNSSGRQRNVKCGLCTNQSIAEKEVDARVTARRRSNLDLITVHALFFLEILYEEKLKWSMHWSSWNLCTVTALCCRLRFSYVRKTR